MAFWNKRPEGAPTSIAVPATPAAKQTPPAELFPPQSRQEIKKLFEPTTETATDVNKVLERFGKLRSALGNGTVIQGRLTFDTPVRIDGKLNGEIFSSAALIVGPSGSVDATVEVSTLVVLGTVKGNVKAADRVEVYAGASLEGVVTAPVLIVERGCSFNGDCKMPQKEVVAKTQPIQKQGDAAPDKKAGVTPQQAPEHKPPEPRVSR